jgi:hypothetical protein
MMKISHRFPPTPSTRETNKILHSAVLDKDENAINLARHNGVRATQLDDNKRSPMDLLRGMQDLDNLKRDSLYQALMESLNPSAPAGYTKPEVFHGSPWGLEILQSKTLKGGANDPKGGSESLEGKVFFSDRTPLTDEDLTVRRCLRQKARKYGEGQGTKEASVFVRGGQLQLLSKFNQWISQGGKPDLSSPALVLELSANNESEVNEAVERYIDKKLTLQIYILSGKSSKQIGEGLRFARQLNMRVSGNTVGSISGKELEQKIVGSADHLKRKLENGKVPFLNMINSGKSIPIVFGFSHVDGLQTHKITEDDGSPSKNYSYKSSDHPLLGSDGSLKEIELKNRQDLSTFLLACKVKSIELPEGVVIRLRGERDKKAAYIEQAGIEEINSQLNARLEEQFGDDRIEAAINNGDIQDLQLMTKFLAPFRFEANTTQKTLIMQG